MKQVRTYFAAYREADGFMQQKESRTKAPAQRQLWADRRNVNDQAYFVLMFTVLETMINSRCDTIIGQKQAQPWPKRALWDNAERKRMRFKQRLALLAEKSGTTFARIIYYYEIRCNIAHGNVYPNMPIAIPTAAAELIALGKALKK
jgi:hypothetical protein